MQIQMVYEMQTTGNAEEQERQVRLTRQQLPCSGNRVFRLIAFFGV